MKSSKTVIEPYSVDFHVYFCEDPRAFARKLIKENPDPAIVNELTKDWLNDDHAGASVSAGMIGKKMDSFGIIALFDITVCKGNMSFLVHESIHVLSHVLLWTGVQYDPKNDEPMSYLADYIFRIIEDTYNQK